MSRIGRRKLPIPQGVNVEVADSTVIVKGPKGALQRKIPDTLHIRIDSQGIWVERKAEDRRTRALHGLIRTLLGNMIVGVTQGYSRSLEIVGVGYRAELAGRELTFQLGYSHKIRFPLPGGIEADLPRPTLVVLRGLDKCLLGQTAAKIRSFREPEPYKGKGIRHVGERIQRKVGKAGAK